MHFSAELVLLVRNNAKSEMCIRDSYNALVKQFRDNKKNRQLIISTHNANIPVASDAENIIVLEYNGQYGYLSQSGSIENPRISHSILNILEGGELAIKSRNEKYKNIKK